MRTRAYLVGCTILAIAGTSAAQTFHPDIPRAWDDKEVESFEVPLAQRDRSPRYLTAEQYYTLKVRPIYRSYPGYAPGREPAGYLESLKQKEPEIIFDPSKLQTKEDWIQAGKAVFETENTFFAAPPGGLDFSASHSPRRATASSPSSSPVPATSCVKRENWSWGSTRAPDAIRASCQTALFSKERRA